MDSPDTPGAASLHRIADAAARFADEMEAKAITVRREDISVEWRQDDDTVKIYAQADGLGHMTEWVECPECDGVGVRERHVCVECEGECSIPRQAGRPVLLAIPASWLRENPPRLRENP